jgi:hypothetical protein
VVADAVVMDTQPASPQRANRGTAPAVRFRLVAMLALLAFALISGLAVSAALYAAAGRPAPSPETWLGLTIVGVAIACAAAGSLIVLAHLAARSVPTRSVERWLAAFAMAPVAIALFFFLVGVGVTGGLPSGYLAAAALVVLAIFAGRLVRSLADRVLFCFFAWLGLLVLPALWQEPVTREFAELMLRIMRFSGVIV